jgi:hypothetical protein
MILEPESKARKGTLMNASRLVRRPLVSLLLVVLVSGLAWATAEYFYQDAYERALAQSEYLIQNERIDSLDTLIARLTAIQFGGLPPMPGAEPWEHSEGPLPVDWESFPKELQDGLIGYWEGNVPVYDLHIWQDRQTREIVIQNSDFVEICTLPCPYAEYCQPETYALYLRPDLYSGKYSQQQIADFVAERDPARVGLHVTLVPTADLFEYLYAKASQQSLLEGLMEQRGGSQMMMSQGGGSGALNDLDGDGVPNREEILAGTNPEDASDYLRITNLQLVAGTREIWWPTASNRQYTVMTSTGGVALLSPQSWSVATQWLDGTGSGIVFTDTLSDIDVAFHHVQVRETDANTNGLPDWWEIEHFGGLTNILATGDQDNDGLDNLEELYYGYSPTNSERTLYHSGFHVVEVPTNNPIPDDGTEEFVFHAAGRPLSLASGATNADWGNNIPTVYGASYSFSGGIFFNNDQSNLYVGICGLERGTDNAFVLFLDSGTGGVTNLTHLSGRPYALGIADNISFNASQFTPNVAIVVGDNRDDGSNNIYRTIGGNDVGQGVYELTSSTNIADFSGFSRTSGGAPLSQWSINGSAGDSPNAGVEVALSLSALDVEPGDTIRVAGLFLAAHPARIAG